VKLHKGSLILQSRRSEISKLENLLFTLNEYYKIDQERFVNFHIAVSEALMNAIVHGNKESAEKRVFVDIFEDDSTLELVISDEGTGFDVSNVPDPTKNNNLYKDHGRGIFIMKSLTDGYECFTGENGTKVKLKILFNK
jgi:serine/threonine-protein kinase RsbW